MLRIESMQMRLPQGFEHRAAAIARLVGDSMAGIETSGNRTLDTLSVGPVQVGPNATDQQIANDIVARIALVLGRTL